MRWFDLASWPWGGWLERHRKSQGNSPGAEADQALARARKALSDDMDRWPEIVRLGDSLRHATVRNHFSEAMERIIRG
jgi:hypothetical protein